MLDQGIISYFLYLDLKKNLFSYVLEIDHQMSSDPMLKSIVHFLLKIHFLLELKWVNNILNEYHFQ